MFPPVTFRIVTHWRATGTIADVAQILTTPADFPRWWGDVYLDVKTVEKGDENGIGQTIDVQSKGWLPYHLHWQGRLVENQMPGRWVIEASGDLVGRGEWTLTQHGATALVTYDWRVTTDRLLFRLLAPLFRPLMVSNHNWAMAKGEAGLQGQLNRRSA